MHKKVLKHNFKLNQPTHVNQLTQPHLINYIVFFYGTKNDEKCLKSICHSILGVFLSNVATKQSFLYV